jgi:predicted metal-dependent hydrolase
MIVTITIVLLIVLLFLSNNKITEFFTTSHIKSTIDSKEYLVVNIYQDKEKAADLIAQINIFTVKLITTLKEKYLTTENKNNTEYIKGREIATILLDRFKSESLRENEPETPDKTSFTTNKGEVISLCLREKVTGKNAFHDISILQFVLLHELGHIITPELNHSALFWTNFKFLLEFSNKYNLYKAPDYEKDNVNYCGLNVSYNPIKDASLTSFFS